MIQLVHRQDTLERTLAASGLDTFKCAEDWFVYGCGLWDPGEDYHLLLRYARAGLLLGAVALTVEEDRLTDYEPLDRKRLGHLLQHAGHISGADRLSTEWMKHFACNAVTDGHPAWLAGVVEPVVFREAFRQVRFDSDDLVQRCFAGGNCRVLEGASVSALNLLHRGRLRDATIFVIANNDLGAAICAALLGVPCVLYIPPHTLGGRYDTLDRHPLSRFAQRYGVDACLACRPEELSLVVSLGVAGELPIVSEERIVAAQEYARLSIQRLLDARTQQPTVVDTATAVASLLGEEVKPQPVVPTMGDAIPELVIGETFDPNTHYREEYFGVGLRYTRPDGTKDIYKGPARHWGGFKKVAEILSGIIPEALGRKYFSLGCGFGDDVKAFFEKGWDAYGMDLSKAAVDGAEVPGRVVRGNVMDPEAFADIGEGFSVVVSFDFWEHIWEGEVSALMSRVHELLVPGGIHLNIICTRGAAEQDHVMEPGVKFTKDNSWLLASGHVTVKRWVYWVNRFREHGFVPDFATSYLFQVARSEDAGLRGADSWDSRNLVVMKKGDR